MKVRSGLEREMTQPLKAKVTTKMKIRSAEWYLATCTVFFFFGRGIRWGRELRYLTSFFSYHDILSIWLKKKKMGLVVLSCVEDLILNTVVLLFSCNF